MSWIVKKGMRVVGVVILATIFVIGLLLTLQMKATSQEAYLESTAQGCSISNDIFPESGAYHGAVLPLEQTDAFECMAGKKLKVIKIYQHFHNGDFYENFATFIHEHGAIEFLSFDPTVKTDDRTHDLNCCQVLSGDYDGIVETFARHIMTWGQPLILSFAGEMNGNWAGWSGAKNFGPNCDQTYTETIDLYGYYGCDDPSQIGCADGPERYRDMYRLIHSIFVSQGVTNVTWAWVVNHDSIPDEGWNQVDNYYPRDPYVDIISVDGYNWGINGPGGWKTFNQVFSATLTFLSSTYPAKPFMLGEFASVEGTDPISKANWITDAYSRIKSDWPQIKAAVWFNLPGDWDFPVESSPESIRAYREAIADPHFVGDPVWCSYLPLVCNPSLPFCTNSGSGGTETITVEPPLTIGGVNIDLTKRALEEYGFSLWEVEIYGPDTGNLAIGATATASSSQDSFGCYGCVPDKAIDGDLGTRWGSEWSEPQWLKIVLPAPHVVSRIVLTWEAAYAEAYCVAAIE